MGGEAEAADPATMLLKKPAGKGGALEPGSEDRSPAGQRCARPVPPCAALAALLSVVAVMSCLYLGVKTNDLQARIAALESAKGFSITFFLCFFFFFPCFFIFFFSSFLSKVKPNRSKICAQ